MSFEDAYPVILNEVNKRKSKWHANLNHIDFDDVRQIILRHIFVKWHLYDKTKSLPNWVQTIATNQINNLLRNHYYNHLKPCARCACNLGDNGCSLVKEGKPLLVQGPNCDIYKRWMNSPKKHDSDINLPLPLENHINYVNNLSSGPGHNIELSVSLFNNMVTGFLSGQMLQYYNLSITEKKKDKDVCKTLGIESFQLKSLSNQVYAKCSSYVYNGEIDI
jgi:hypothetical protein